MRPATADAPATTAADRLSEARALLLAGDVPNARGELEAAAAQLALRPAFPSGPDSVAPPNLAAQQANRALRLLDTGQPQAALAYINAALSELPNPSWTAAR